jgi:signal transduction histidine kinase
MAVVHHFVMTQSRFLEGAARMWRRGLPPSLVLQVVRIPQEAMNNALEHAQAGNIWVSVSCTHEGPLEVQVTDDGVGIDSARAHGTGLDSMQRRAQALGGECTITRYEPGPGTKVTLRVPASAWQGVTRT